MRAPPGEGPAHPGTGAPGRSGTGEEGADGHCRGSPRPERTWPVPQAAASLHAFVTDYVEPGARVITDGWQGYHGLERLGSLHDRHSQRAARARGEDPHELLPAVHRVASLVKRWLLGTHQGSVGDVHLRGHLNEFVFRFNRRRSRWCSSGCCSWPSPMCPSATRTWSPTRTLPPLPPPTRGHPPSLDRPPANRPWRATASDNAG